MPDLQTALSSVLKSWESNAIMNEQQPAEPEEKPIVNQTPIVKSERQPDGSVRFVPINNVTRETFEYVKAHPGISMLDATEGMAKQGFKRSSVSSLMSQMLRQGLFVKDANKGYHVAVKEYVAVKSAPKQRKVEVTTKTVKTRREAYKRKAKPEAKAPAPVAVPVAAPVVSPKPADPEFNAESFIERQRLTLRESRLVYEYLRTVFGTI